MIHRAGIEGSRVHLAFQSLDRRLEAGAQSATDGTSRAAVWGSEPAPTAGVAGRTREQHRVELSIWAEHELDGG